MIAEDVLDYLARSLVDNPDDVEVEVVGEDDDGAPLLELRVHPDDMGKVIGKRGRTAKALRSLVKAAASQEDDSASVEIVEHEG